MEESMDTPDSDDLADLADAALIERFQYTDWNDPRFVKDERLVQLFNAARADGNTARVGCCSSELSRRMLRRAKGFAYQYSLVPQHFSHLDEAAHELAGYVWERLLTSKNAAYAARRFGVFFDHKATSFLRELLAEKRSRPESLEEWHEAGRNDEGKDGWQDENYESDDWDATLHDEQSPERVATHQQKFAQVHAKLQTLLTSKEYSVFVMSRLREMKVKDIATALGVTPRQINNLQRSIAAKVNQEFKV